MALFTSCQTSDDLGLGADNKDAQFVTTSPEQYTISMTRGTASTTKSQTYKGEMTASVSEDTWNEATAQSNMTRGEISGDEILWKDDEPSLGVYITNADDNTLIARNLAICPISHKFYPKYYDIKSHDGTPLAINNASFFWTTDWKDKTALPTKANFYGYYPRPRNNDISVGATQYAKTSIISNEDAAGLNTNKDWWSLHYTFIDETDDNMSWHDVMYALPEAEDTEYRYGNQDKQNGDDIQLHFAHAFSLLDIEVNRGDKYQDKCVISSISLSGTQVFTEGDLDIKSGTISPSNSSDTETGLIKRVFNDTQITKDTPIRKTMIVQPTQDGDNPSDNNRLVITCCIDGVNYSCALPNLVLKAGKKYKIKQTLSPSGILVFKIWNGAKVKIGDTTYTPDDSEKEMATRANTFSIESENGFKIIDILRNGTSIFKNGQTEYDLTRVEGANTYYNVVTAPCDESGNQFWYATEGAQMLFDGIYNNYRSKTQDKQLNIWYDLSGNNNDGTLRSFSAPAGWDGYGLQFDGLDDVVYFSGKINTSYTMEMYVCVDPVQRGAHPRFTAEGPYYPCFYFYGTGQNYDGVHTSTATTRSLAFYDAANLSTGTQLTTDGKALFQLDFAYDNSTGIIKWYVNGEYKGERTTQTPKSLATASIGNKVSDNSRALAGTYYSFIIYNRALGEDEIKANYNVNTTRYGTTKP